MIKDKTKDNILEFIHNIKFTYRRIKRLFKWIPVIWNSYYDWDYRSAIDVFQYQLERIADMLESNRSISVESKHNATRIRTAIRLMNKVYDEEYAMEYFNEIERIYGKSKYDFLPVNEKGELVDTSEPDKPEFYRMVTIWERDYTDEEIKNIEVHTRELLLKYHHKQKKAHRILWAFIEHNIQNWWD